MQTLITNFASGKRRAYMVIIVIFITTILFSSNFECTCRSQVLDCSKKSGKCPRFSVLSSVTFQRNFYLVYCGLHMCAVWEISLTEPKRHCCLAKTSGSWLLRSDYTSLNNESKVNVFLSFYTSCFLTCDINMS